MKLNDTLQVFHQQLQLLGINSEFSYLWLPDEENDKHVFWAAWEEEKNKSTVLKSKALAYPLDRNEPATARMFGGMEKRNSDLQIQCTSCRSRKLFRCMARIVQ